MKFIAGQKVKVVRVKSNKTGESDEYGHKYPKIGWEGILTREYNNKEWVIKWITEEAIESSGDLIREWMLGEAQIKQYGIVEFCKKNY